MTDEPKKPIISGIDIVKLPQARPTRIPSALPPSQLRPQITNYKRIAIDAGILAVIILLAYGASVIGEFVYNDHYIDNLLAIKLSEESFWSNLIIQAISKPLSQPWIMASFAFDLQNFSYDASWYHIVNIVLHFLSCFYFYLFAYWLARYFWQDDGEREPVHEVALLAAAILACHPLAAEAVAHISGRVATLSACNFFLTLDFFLWAFLVTKIKTMLRNYLLTFFFLWQAIFCGVEALAIPAVMLFMALLIRPIGTTRLDWLKHKWGEIGVVVFLLLATPCLAMRGFSADFSNGFVLPLPSWQIYVASQFKSLIAYYGRCFVVPIGLSIFPPFTISNGFADPFFILGILFLVLCAMAVYKYRKQPISALGLAIAFLTFLPPIFFVQNEIAADWRFYLPIAGLALFIASTLKPWLFGWKDNRKIQIISCICLVLLMTVTVLRILNYRTDITLFKSAVRVNESDAWAKGMLALSLIKARKIQGIELAKQAIAMNKDCQPAYLALGKAYMPLKRDQVDAISKYWQALEPLEKALTLAQSQHLGNLVLFECERDLGTVLVELGQYEKAKKLTEHALSMNPNSVILNLTIGKILNHSGEYLKAMVHLNKGYSRDSANPDYVEPLAEAALHIANPSLINAAYNISKMGIIVCPTHKMRLLLAQAALATGRLNESLRWSDVALKESPNDPAALYVRSFALRASGQYKLAHLLKEQALKADPSLPKKIIVVGLNKEKTAIIPIEELYPLAKRGAAN